MTRTLFSFTMLALILMWTCTPGGVSAASPVPPGSVAGTYVNQQNSKEYLTLRADGTFSLKQQRKPYNVEHPYMTLEGSYSLEGEKVLLKLKDGGEAEGKIQGNAFVDAEGKSWVNEKVPGPKKEEMDTPLKKRRLF